MSWLPHLQLVSRCLLFTFLFRARSVTLSKKGGKEEEVTSAVADLAVAEKENRANSCSPFPIKIRQDRDCQICTIVYILSSIQYIVCVCFYLWIRLIDFTTSFLNITNEQRMKMSLGFWIGYCFFIFLVCFFFYLQRDSFPGVLSVTPVSYQRAEKEVNPTWHFPIFKPQNPKIT